MKMTMTKRSLGMLQLLTLAAALVMAVLVATPAFAASYRIRLYAGNEGKVSLKGAGNWSDNYVEVTRDYGTRVSLSDLFDVKVDDGTKYYFKGYRTSGKDNRDFNGLRDSLEVDRDMDFVVAYGSRTNMTTYTIRFVEQGSGRALTNDKGHTEETYEGKVGDKPVVAYSYVPGYRPLYNNITGTLTDGENVWRLPYVALEQPTETTTDEGTTTTTTTTTVESTTSGGGTTTSTSTSSSSGSTSESTNEGTESTSDNNDNASTSDNNDSDNATNPGPNPNAQDQSNNQPTEEILDVDNPLAAPDANGGDTNEDDKPNHGSNTTGSTDPNETEGSGGPSGKGFGLAIGALVAALLLGMMGFLWYRTKHETGSGDDDLDLDLDLGDDED